MPRRVASERALECIAEAVTICAKLGETHDLLADQADLWREAFDEGATYRQIAEPCGVSEHWVRLQVSRARGRRWAVET